MKKQAARIAVVVMVSLAAVACGAGEASSKGEIEANFRVSEEATAADVGLPMYPGSKAYKDSDDSSSAANIGFSTPLFGMKIVAMNLETSDEPEQVRAFYRQALSKYGNVLECSDAADGEKRSQQSDGLVCDSDDSGKHNVVYKAGNKENQRIVAVKPHGKGTRFSLVHLNIRGEPK